jgi:GNAT superfamily N-acetyltransferase
MEIIEVNPENIDEHGVFCSKNLKSEGFRAKRDWYLEQFEEGWRIAIAFNDNKQLGFIEYGPSELSWRPVAAENMLFIQCIMVQSKNDRSKGLASALIDHVLKEAKKQSKLGLCSITSKGSWLAGPDLFLKNGFEQFDSKGRFELMFRKLDQKCELPRFIDWDQNIAAYESGWHLLYANQCPWHIKSVTDLKKVSDEMGFVLNTWELKSREEMKSFPSGFGVFALVKDGKLLEDHYISATRFKNIIKKELS